MRPMERAVPPLMVLEQQLAGLQPQMREAGDSLGRTAADTAVAGLPARRLPTLREALDQLSTEQNKMRETLEQMQQDIQRMGLMVAELAELAQGLNALRSDTPSTALTRREYRGTRGRGKTVRTRAHATAGEKTSAKTVAEHPPEGKATAGGALSNAAVLQQYTKALQHIARQEYGNAWELLERVVKEAKDPVLLSNAHYWRGDIAFRQGQYGQAITELQAVIQHSAAPKAAAAYALLAESYLRQGDRERARQYFQTLVQRFPTSEFAPRALKRLQQL